MLQTAKSMLFWVGNSCHSDQFCYCVDVPHRSHCSAQREFQFGPSHTLGVVNINLPPALLYLLTPWCHHIFQQILGRRFVQKRDGHLGRLLIGKGIAMKNRTHLLGGADHHVDFLSHFGG